MDFAVRIKDATEAIQQVPSLVDAISTLLQTSSGCAVLCCAVLCCAVLLILAFWILLNKNFFLFFAAIERRKRRRLEHIESYVANSSMADIDSVTVFRDIRDAYYFKHATGIYAEKRLRSSLIELHEQLSPSLGWAHIQRAFSYLEIYSAGKFAVRVQSRFEKVGYWYNEVMGYMSILTSALIITILIFSDKLGEIYCSPQ
jgi:hypothetical protein